MDRIPIRSLDELVSNGEIQPPTSTLPFTMPAGAPVPGQDAGELISGLRDEERW